MRLTDHRVVERKRRISPSTNPHPVAEQIETRRPEATRMTCETNWKTKQDSQDRSTDRGGVPQYVTMTATPDISSTSPGGPNTATQTNLTYIAT